jgi:hypothetical protein
MRGVFEKDLASQIECIKIKTLPIFNDRGVILFS